MKVLKESYLVVLLFLTGFFTSANAGTITSGTIVSNDMGELYSATGINNINNRSGLATAFNSGIDDFDAYLATPGAIHSYFGATEWFSNNALTGSIIFDLGDIYNVDRLAIWNEDSQGIATFTVSTSTINTWGAFGSGVLFSAVNRPHNTPYSAEVFSITSLARYVKIDVLTVHPHETGSPFLATLGEVAFSTNPVPEPTTVLLLGAGLLGLAGMRRKK